jgi:hypothetical protein
MTSINSVSSMNRQAVSFGEQQEPLQAQVSLDSPKDEFKKENNTVRNGALIGGGLGALINAIVMGVAIKKDGGFNEMVKTSRSFKTIFDKSPAKAKAAAVGTIAGMIAIAAGVGAIVGGGLSSAIKHFQKKD